VWGGRDPIIPVAHARRAHEALPGSRLEVFETSGHTPHLEEPARFAHAVQRHVLGHVHPVGPAALSAS
jgi:pimeloyl-ACP methyl ester carboxylesterase